MRDRYIPEFTRRLQAGWAIADAGGSQGAFATAEGVSDAAISKWLREHRLDALRDALQSARHNRGLPAEAEERRASRIASALRAKIPMRRVAEAEGVSDAAICFWRQKNWTLVDDYMACQPEKPSP